MPECRCSWLYQAKKSRQKLRASKIDPTRAGAAGPDPEAVGPRPRQMAHAWVGVTNLEQEDFERLAAERQARRRATNRQQER
jgi:hypothetical protein